MTRWPIVQGQISDWFGDQPEAQAEMPGSRRPRQPVNLDPGPVTNVWRNCAISDGSQSPSPNPDERLVSLLKQDADSMTTLQERYGPMLELVRTFIGVVPNCDGYLEIWPPAFRTYNLMVPNFLNLARSDCSLSIRAWSTAALPRSALDRFKL
jgi:hypothetical protein